MTEKIFVRPKMSRMCLFFVVVGINICGGGLDHDGLDPTWSGHVRKRGVGLLANVLTRLSGHFLQSKVFTKCVRTGLDDQIPET